MGGEAKDYKEVDTPNKHDGDQERKAVRRAERAPWNRLLSVVHDAAWVSQFCQVELPHLPVLPNLRCGAWYVPSSSNGHRRTRCYFKSTDGHTNAWAFSLKRYNPAVLALIEQRDGCVIVDATRRGKSMPDALSKTIPIWCAVINAAAAVKKGAHTSIAQAAALRLPQHIVSPSEHAQIAARLRGWVDDLLESDLYVPMLAKPLRPLFVSRSHVDEGLRAVSEAQHDDSKTLPYTPVVLVSASAKMDATPDALATVHTLPIGCSFAAALGLSADVHRLAQDAKFVYVQGAGDDEEMWSQKLTPELLWRHDNLRRILQTNGDVDALQSTVAQIVLQERMAAMALHNATQSDCEIGSLGIWFGHRAVAHVFSDDERAKYGLIVQVDGEDGQDAAAVNDTNKEDDEHALQHILRLGVEHGKRGLHTFRHALPKVIAAVQHTLPRPILLCSAEADGIGHDLNGGAAVCLLATCFDADKQLRKDINAVAIPSDLSKDDVQRRLQWITTALPHAKPPSRKHLLRVNEVLLSKSSA